MQMCYAKTSFLSSLPLFYNYLFPLAINYFNLFNCYLVVISHYILDNNIIYKTFGYVINISNFSRWVIIVNGILINIRVQPDSLSLFFTLSFSQSNNYLLNYLAICCCPLAVMHQLEH